MLRIEKCCRGITFPRIPFAGLQRRDADFCGSCGPAIRSGKIEAAECSETGQKNLGKSVLFAPEIFQIFPRSRRPCSLSDRKLEAPKGGSELPNDATPLVVSRRSINDAAKRIRIGL